MFEKLSKFLKSKYGKILIIIVLSILTAVVIYMHLHGRYTGLLFPGITNYLFLPLRHRLLVTTFTLIVAVFLYLLMFKRELLAQAYSKSKIFIIDKARQRKEKPMRLVTRVVVALVLIITSIAAIIVIPRISSNAPQIIAMTPGELAQQRYAPHEIEVTIAGMHFSEDTVIYANNLRVSHVWETVREESEENGADIFGESGALYGFDRGLSFYLPHILLTQPGEVSIVAVNNADAVIPARSNRVSIQVMEALIPEITSVTVTELTDMMHRLHIHGANFDEDAKVQINNQDEAVVIVQDAANINVYFDASNLPLIFPPIEADEDDAVAEGDDIESPQRDPREVPVVVLNSGGRRSNAFILTELPRIDATTTIVHNTDWIGVGSNLIASGLGGLNEEMIHAALERQEPVVNTNSKEAFMQNYELGFRLFELSTQFSADGILFGIHPAMRTMHSTFRQEQASAPYTLMTFEDIAQLMVEYDDCWLITDTKYHDNLHALRSTFDYMMNVINNVDEDLINRIIVQVYNQRMYYFMINNFPFNSYIYNLYASQDSNSEVLEFVERTGVPAVSMEPERTTLEFIESLGELGAAVFVHSNRRHIDLHPVDLQRFYELREMGVIGIYTHYITPDMLRMTIGEIEQWELDKLTTNTHNAFITFVENLEPQPLEDYVRIINVGNFYSIQESEDADVGEQHNDHDRISAGNVNLNYIPEVVSNAFLTLANLESEPITYITHNRYLLLDGYQYSHRVEDNVITIITYNRATRQIVEGVIFDPHNNFARIDIDFIRDNNRRYFLEYLNNLLYEDLIVFMSVRDDASEDLDEGILEALASLGLGESLHERQRYSYIAVIDGHTVIHEELSYEPIEYVNFLHRWLFEVSSAGWPESNSSISINGAEHSRNARGINIVVFNKITGMVEDSVAFDTHNMLHITRG